MNDELNESIGINDIRINNEIKYLDDLKNNFEINLKKENDLIIIETKRKNDKNQDQSIIWEISKNYPFVNPKVLIKNQEKDLIIKDNQLMNISIYLDKEWVPKYNLKYIILRSWEILDINNKEFLPKFHNIFYWIIFMIFIYLIFELKNKQFIYSSSNNILIRSIGDFFVKVEYFLENIFFKYFGYNGFNSVIFYNFFNILFKIFTYFVVPLIYLYLKYNIYKHRYIKNLYLYLIFNPSSLTIFFNNLFVSSKIDSDIYGLFLLTLLVINLKDNWLISLFFNFLFYVDYDGNLILLVTLIIFYCYQNYLENKKYNSSLFFYFYYSLEILKFIWIGAIFIMFIYLELGFSEIFIKFENIIEDSYLQTIIITPIIVWIIKFYNLTDKKDKDIIELLLFILIIEKVVFLQNYNLDLIIYFMNLLTIINFELKNNYLIEASIINLTMIFFKYNSIIGFIIYIVYLIHLIIFKKYYNLKIDLKKNLNISYYFYILGTLIVLLKNYFFKIKNYNCFIEIILIYVFIKIINKWLYSSYYRSNIKIKNK